MPKYTNENTNEQAENGGRRPIYGDSEAMQGAQALSTEQGYVIEPWQSQDDGSWGPVPSAAPRSVGTQPCPTRMQDAAMDTGTLRMALLCVLGLLVSLFIGDSSGMTSAAALMVGRRSWGSLMLSPDGVGGDAPRMVTINNGGTYEGRTVRVLEVEEDGSLIVEHPSMAGRRMRLRGARTNAHGAKIESQYRDDTGAADGPVWESGQLAPTMDAVRSVRLTPTMRDALATIVRGFAPAANTMAALVRRGVADEAGNLTALGWRVYGVEYMPNAACEGFSPEAAARIASRSILDHACSMIGDANIGLAYRSAAAIGAVSYRGHAQAVHAAALRDDYWAQADQARARAERLISARRAEATTYARELGRESDAETFADQWEIEHEKADGGTYRPTLPTALAAHDRLMADTRATICGDCEQPYTPADIDAIVGQYIGTVLWSTSDPDGPQAVQDAEYELEGATTRNIGADIEQAEAKLSEAQAKAEDHGENLDTAYDIDDLHPSALDAIRTDVLEFVGNPDNGDALRAYVTERGEDTIGHDFALTRDGHGAGFWDRGLGDAGQRLTDASKTFGESGIYPGDDGKLYVSGHEPARVSLVKTPCDECYGPDGSPLMYGRCDTCGSPCDIDGCTTHRGHVVALSGEKEVTES